MKQRASFRIEPDLLAEARRASEVQRVPLTRLLEDALREHLGLGTRNVTEDLERRVSRLEELAGL